MGRRLPDFAHDEVTGRIEAGLRARPGHGARKPFVLGIAGAQGSGKSTVAARLAGRLRARGLACALLSLDDLYLDGARRAALARSVHPLLRTRGVPGTHDIGLWLAIVEALGKAGSVALPRFDKARDEPAPRGSWDVFEGPADMLILEGWCLGARPQASEALDAPINALERDSDPDGSWRLYVNDQLAGPYRRLFDRIDLRVLLAAPDFDTVAGWRIEQEQTLRAQCLAEGRTAGKLMTDAEVRRFVAYFQRITEQMLRDAASIADLVIPLDAHRRPLAS